MGVMYGWKPGARSGGDAHKIGVSIARIEKRDGLCSPEALVEAARRPTHPAHERFEWDDTLAARSHREHQARTIINSIRVVVDEEEQPAPAFVHIREVTEDGVSSGYRTTATAMADPRDREQVVADAARQLEGWLNRVAALEEFAPVRRALEEVKGAMAA